MLARLIEQCARRRGFTALAVALLAIWGAWSLRTTPLDALPDLSDTQVIVFTEWMGRSPNLVEDQITYPIVTTFLAAPRVNVVRGFTMFGMSFVYVIFEDGTDIYWARSRVLEYLVKLQGKLPPGVAPQLGPDATGVGWVFEYALVDETGQHDLQQLRSFQDWHLRYWLSSVPGVAEVASLGGYEKEYQVEIDPVRLQAFDLSISDIAAAIRMSNGDVGGRVVELAQHEYAVRGRGYLQSRDAIAKIVIATDARGTPVQLGDIARVQVGGNIRRGFAELDGTGETVGGIVVMRFGENALAVIERVKAKLAEMEPAMPPGVRVVTTYDRSQLINASVRTLSTNLLQVMVIVCAMVVVFLFHFRSALVPAITLPIAVLLAFIPMSAMGLTTNIMSLAGIIIAIGDMVDAAVVLVENAHRKLEERGPGADRVRAVIDSAKELGPPIFGSLLLIAVAFLPVFTLEAQEGRLFKPLAYTKTLAMAFAALLSVTLVPALMVWFVRGRILAEAENPIARALRAAYRPVLRWCLVHRKGLVVTVAAGIVATLIPFFRLGSEFMPPLYEGSVLFMPISVPGISIEEAKRLVQEQDRRLKEIPEVTRVFGKAGRAETATDPAPLSMIETVITLRPREEWRAGLTYEDLLEEMDRAVATPGLQAAWTMPIKARVDMLTTGIRTPIGIKVFGTDLEQIAELAESLERILRDVPGTRSVYAERELGGFFIDFVPDRDAIARYGLRSMDVLDVVETAIGGLDVDTTIEGRERYRINVRYPRELRDTPEALARVLVPVPLQRGGAIDVGIPASLGGMVEGPSGPAGGMRMGSSGRSAQVRLGQLGTLSATMGPPMIKNEEGLLTGWVYVDTESRDIGGYVENAKRAVTERLALPPGYFLRWTGQYEFLERMQARMRIVVPLTVGLILAILYLNFGGLPQALLVLFSVPCAAMGSIWLLWALGFNTSVAVWVGLIGLLGIAAETASIMVIYLDEGYRSWQAAGRLRTTADLVEMALESGSQRVRPLLMTVGMNIVGLVPVMFDTGIGSDVAKRIAAPLWGGLLSLTLLTLAVIPALYVIWRSRGLPAPAPAA
ncbi:MAG TPA: CusA/CzcA family heavy metal efflux RND transporter [Myxococcota bacterium]|nr:CusA/CzcA family heavy metal efflux RND transporter [Myxococcota bacterium]